MSTIYTRGQAVMLDVDGITNGEWTIGIVTRPTDPQYGWTGADFRRYPNQSVNSSVTPGFKTDQIRIATEQDIAALPQWKRDWLEIELLNFRDPKIPSSSNAVSRSLTSSNLHRLSDLQQVSDAQLLALKGIGKQTVESLRTWQAAVHQQEGQE
jgi:hypothetical protein